MLPPIAPDNTEADPSPPPAPVLGYDSPINAGNSAAIVWFRILAVWLFANAIHSGTAAIGQIVYYWYNYASYAGVRGFNPAMQVLAITGLPTITWFLLAWYCWAGAPRMAHRASIGVDTGAPARLGVSGDELLGVLLIAVGVYLLSDGLAETGRFFSLAVIRGRQGNPIFNDVSSAIFAAALRILLGLWLILGNRGIVNLIRRYSGRWKIESQSPQRDAQAPQVHP
jgi:hypothetical protein